MPVYEYKCSHGHHYELTQSFDAPTRQRCPYCGTPARRQISLPAVIFKGSGFYHTDHGRGSSHTNGSSSTPIDSTSAPSSDDQGHSHDSDGGSESSVAATTD